MKVTLSNNKIKAKGAAIGYYQQDGLGIKAKWYGEYKLFGTTYVRTGNTLQDLRDRIKSDFND